MFARMRPTRPMRFGKALPVLFLVASCALCACADRNASPVPAEPDREHSQGAPLQGPPPVVEQRIDDPVRPMQPAPQPPAEQRAARQASLQSAPQIRPTSAPTGPGYIILQPGETLSYISALYAVSEKDLVTWNSLSSAQDVHAGQRLAIRPPSLQSAPPVPQTAAPVQAGTAPDGTVIVASGQTLSGIAQLHGATVPQLREWNGLTSDTLRVGQQLRVRPPRAGGSGAIGTPAAEGRMVLRPPQEASHGAATPDANGMITVQAGQSLSGIAAKYKVSATDLRQWNKLKDDRLHTGQQLRVKAPLRVHTVKAGESLSGIAAKYKVSPKALMQRNKLTNADVLPVGKELIVP